MKKKPVRKKPIPAAWIPAVIALLLAFNTLPNQFCLDDFCVIVNNDYVQAGVNGIPEILHTNYFNGFNRFNDGLYRPVPMVTFALETTLFGPGPYARHVVNLLIYALTGYVLFLLLKKIFNKTNILLPLVITLLYIAHPVHTEAVANIKGRDELLAFLFMILSALQVFRYYDDGKVQSLILGIFFFLLGLLSKESAVSFILLIPLMILFFRRPELKKLLMVLILMGTITVAWFVLRHSVIASMTSPVDKGIFTAFNNSVLSSGSFPDRFATGLYLLVQYLWKMLVPIPLSHDYSFNQIPVLPLFSIRTLVSVVVLAGLLGAAILAFKRNRALTFSVLFFLIAIAPVANILIYIGATFAERFLYTPSLGFSILTGILLFLLIRKQNPSDSWNRILTANPGFTAVFLLLLSVYSALFVLRNSEWMDNYTLYATDVNRSPNSARTHYNYGSELVNRARSEQFPEQKMRMEEMAMTELNTALNIYPPYLDALNNMGNLWESKNNLDSSNACYEKILKIDSTYLKAYFNLGLNYYKMQQPAQSNVFLEELVRRQPDHAKALYLLGNNYGSLGRFDLAVNFLERCVRVDAGNADARMLLGKAYGYQRNFEKAIEIFLRILAEEPGNFDANYSIGVSYRMTGKIDQALVHLLRCEQIQPANPAVLKELASCYRETGDPRKAAEYDAKFGIIPGRQPQPAGSSTENVQIR